MKRTMLVVLVVMFGVGLVVSNGYTEEALVVTVSGAVESQSQGAGDWKSCKIGQKCVEKDKIKCGASGKAMVKLEDGTWVKLERNSTISLDELKGDSKGIGVEVGRVRTKVQKLKSGSKFQVKTPTAVCSVRGTEFQVEVGEDMKTVVSLYSGLLGVRNIAGLGEEIVVHPNERVEVLPNLPASEPTAIPASESQAAAPSATNTEIRQEIKMDMSREQIQAAAASEKKAAEYQEGKTMIDVFGKRVRIDEYVVRPQNTKDQVKMVVLNERDERFDYLIWKGTFKKDLPPDLTVATKNMWESDALPEYQLKDSETGVSNTADKIEWLNNDATYNLESDNKYRPTFNKFELKVNNEKQLSRIGTAWSLGATLTPITMTFANNKGTMLGEDVLTLSSDGKNYLMNGESVLTKRSNGDWYLYNETKVSKDSISGQPVINTENAFDLWVYKNIAVATNMTNAYEKYNITFASNKSLSEEYYWIDDTGKQMKWADDLLKLNQETVWSSDSFKGKDKKIDLVVEPKIFTNSGIKIK